MKNSIFSASSLMLYFLLAIISTSSLAENYLMPPDTKVKGRSTAQLSVDWWQWAMAEPPEKNPVRDITGSNCAIGQSGDVWFLAGGFGSSKIRRTCTIPANKTLFFPLVNMLYYKRETDRPYTCAQANASAAIANDTAINLFAEIDGLPLKDLKKYRAKSDKCFNVFAKVPPLVSTYNAFPSASDGYWLLIKSLPKGHHKIKFGGAYIDSEASPGGHMIQDIEYELIVQ